MGDSANEPIRALFVCHYNQKRSATAERVFAKDPTLDVLSAGTSEEAMVQVNRRMLEWADIVFVMDDDQVRDLQRMFPGHPALDGWSASTSRTTITSSIPDAGRDA